VTPEEAAQLLLPGTRRLSEAEEQVKQRRSGSLLTGQTPVVLAGSGLLSGCCCRPTSRHRGYLRKKESFNGFAICITDSEEFSHFGGSARGAWELRNPEPFLNQPQYALVLIKGS
jgi:hypothetical protein